MSNRKYFIKTRENGKGIYIEVDKRWTLLIDDVNINYDTATIKYMKSNKIVRTRVKCDGMQYIKFKAID